MFMRFNRDASGMDVVGEIGGRDEQTGSRHAGHGREGSSGARSSRTRSPVTGLGPSTATLILARSMRVPFVRTDRIGDTVCTLPAIADLHDAFERACHPHRHAVRTATRRWSRRTATSNMS